MQPIRKHRKLYLLVPAATMALVSARAGAQVMYEPFDYGAGSVGTNVDNLTGSPSFSGYVNPMSGVTWFNASTNAIGATSTDLQVLSGNLSLANRPASTGNSGGKTDNNPMNTARIGIGPGGITQVAGQKFYYSMLLNVGNTTSLATGTSTGVILAAFNNSVGTQAALPSALATRLQIRADTTDSTKFNLGVRTNSTAAIAWAPDVLSPGSTQFIVGSYEVGAGASDDVQSIWVNPATGDQGAATAPIPSASASGGTEINIASFVWRNFWQTPTNVGQLGPFQVDDIRMDNNWGQVTAPAGTSWAGGSGAWSASLPDGANNFVNLNPGGGNVSVDAGGKTVGTITVRSSSSYTLSGPGTLTMSAGAGTTPMSAINIQPEMNGVNATPPAAAHFISANVVLANSLGINVGVSQALTMSGNISGTGGLVKNGAGELRLTGSNSFDNGAATGVVISNGTVTINGDAALGAVPAAPQNNIQINRAMLRFDGSFATSPNRGMGLAAGNGGVLFSALDVTSGNTATFTGIITGSAAGSDLFKSGNGTLVLSGINTYTNTAINAGTLSVSQSENLGGLGGSLTFNSGTLQTTGSFSAMRNVLVKGAGTFDTAPGTTVSFTGNVTGTVGSLAKSNSGVLVLAGNDTYTVPTAINGGSIQAGSVNAVPNSTVSVNVNNGLDLNGFNALIGGLSGNGAIAMTGTPSIGNNSENTTFGGATSGTGGLTKIGSGSLTLTGTQGYTGPTTVTLGKLVVATNLTKTSSTSVADQMEMAAGGGSNRVLRSGNLTFSGTGKLNLQDNKAILTAMPVGSWNGTAYTDVTGLVTSGKGSSNLWDGPTGIVTTQTQAIGSNYTSIGVAKASDVRPATATATGLWAGQTITGSDVLVMYTYGGDATLDGKINIDDYVKIDSGIAAGLTGWSNGDFNYDGKVSIDDYITVIDANIGNQTGVFPTVGGLSGVTAVPEPASVGLLGLGAVGWLARRRRAAR